MTKLEIDDEVIFRLFDVENALSIVMLVCKSVKRDSGFEEESYKALRAAAGYLDYTLDAIYNLIDVSALHKAQSMVGVTA